MSSPSSPVLQRLCCLDRSSPDFQDQLSDVLYGQEYRQYAPSLQSNDLVWLVEYLDKVRYRVALPTLRSNQRRHSMISILPIPLLGSVYASSEPYAGRRRCSQCLTRFRLIFWSFVPTHSPREVIVMCITGHSIIQGFASNVCGCISRMVLKRPLKCIIDAIAPPNLSSLTTRTQQAFCQEAVIWKRLRHLNILPLLGVTISPLQLISDWMPGGDLSEYIKTHPDADRLGLVSSPPVAFVPRLLPSPAIRRR